MKELRLLLRENPGVTDYIIKTQAEYPAPEQKKAV